MVCQIFYPGHVKGKIIGNISLLQFPHCFQLFKIIFILFFSLLEKVSPHFDWVFSSLWHFKKNLLFAQFCKNFLPIYIKSFVGCGLRLNVFFLSFILFCDVATLAIIHNLQDLSTFGYIDQPLKYKIFENIFIYGLLKHEQCIDSTWWLYIYFKFMSVKCFKLN